MPGPLLTFEGGAAAQFCACAPPDSDGDVGPNHYVEAINQAFAIFDKSGNMLAGPIYVRHALRPLGYRHALRQQPKLLATHLLCMISWLIAG